MKLTNKVVMTCAVLAVMMVMTGCTNWKKKYNALDVEHQNLKGLYENCVASLDGSAGEKGMLNKQLADCKSQLSKAMAAQKARPQDTGFRGDVKVDEAAGTITVTLPNSILFSSGKSSLKSANSSDLDHIYSVLRQKYSGKKVDVIGHTDTDPIRKTKNLYKDNWDLSAKRALTVVRYLVDRGIAKESICGVACGEARPVASNSSTSGKAKNRRVEIVVHTR
ncbi:MAG: OmpA/MotB family protein [Planctomycetota bacterium]|jgi:chemotaxis protein MotB